MNNNKKILFLLIIVILSYPILIYASTKTKIIKDAITTTISSSLSVLSKGIFENISTTILNSLSLLSKGIFENVSTFIISTRLGLLKTINNAVTTSIQTFLIQYHYKIIVNSLSTSITVNTISPLINNPAKFPLLLFFTVFGLFIFIIIMLILFIKR